MTGKLGQVRVLQRLLVIGSLECPKGGPRKLRPVLECCHIRVLLGMNLPVFPELPPFLGSRMPLPVPVGGGCPFSWFLSLFTALEHHAPFPFSCPSWDGADVRPDVNPSAPSPVEVGLFGELYQCGGLGRPVYTVEGLGQGPALRGSQRGHWDAHSAACGSSPSSVPKLTSWRVLSSWEAASNSWLSLGHGVGVEVQTWSLIRRKGLFVEKLVSLAPLLGNGQEGHKVSLCSQLLF